MFLSFFHEYESSFKKQHTILQQNAFELFRKFDKFQQ